MCIIFTKVLSTNDVIPYRRSYFVAVWHACFKNLFSMPSLKFMFDFSIFNFVTKMLRLVFLQDYSIFDHQISILGYYENTMCPFIHYIYMKHENKKVLTIKVPVHGRAT